MDLVVQVGAWSAWVAALSLAAWALFWDRARGGVRCPRCWYDMAGTPARTNGGRVCPECGRRILNQRELGKTRRRWRWVAVSALVATAGYALKVTPAVREGGWRAALPTTLLVATPIVSAADYVDSEMPVTEAQFRNVHSALTDELMVRFLRGEVAGWQAELWVRRLRHALVARGLPEVPRADRRLLRELNATYFGLAIDGATLDEIATMFGRQTGLGFVVDWPALDQVGVSREARVSMKSPPISVADGLDAVLREVSPEDWTAPRWILRNGGIVITSEQMPARDRHLAVMSISGLVERIRHSGSRPVLNSDCNWGGETEYISDDGWREWIRDDILKLIEISVDTDGWEVWGGCRGRLYCYGDRLLIWNTPSNLEHVRLLLERLGRRATGPYRTPDAEALRLLVGDSPGDVPAMLDGGSAAPAPSVQIIYDIADLLNSDLSPIFSETWDSLEDGSAERLDLICELLEDEVEPESWTAHGGSIGDARGLGPRLIIRATPPTHAQIVQFLGGLRTMSQDHAGG